MNIPSLRSRRLCERLSSGGMRCRPAIFSSGGMRCRPTTKKTIFWRDTIPPYDLCNACNLRMNIPSPRSRRLCERLSSGGMRCRPTTKKSIFWRDTIPPYDLCNACNVRMNIPSPRSRRLCERLSSSGMRCRPAIFSSGGMRCRPTMKKIISWRDTIPPCDLLFRRHAMPPYDLRSGGSLRRSVAVSGHGPPRPAHSSADGSAAADEAQRLVLGRIVSAAWHSSIRGVAPVGPARYSTGGWCSRGVNRLLSRPRRLPGGAGRWRY